jgi:hypothetical protein
VHLCGPQHVLATSHQTGRSEDEPGADRTLSFLGVSLGDGVAWIDIDNEARDPPDHWLAAVPVQVPVFHGQLVAKTSSFHPPDDSSCRVVGMDLSASKMGSWQPECVDGEESSRMQATGTLFTCPVPNPQTRGSRRDIIPHSLLAFRWMGR